MNPEKLYDEVIRLLDDLSDKRNWIEHTVGDHCEVVLAHEYYPMRDGTPWIEAGRVRDLFERYVEAVTKVRRRPKDV